MMELANAHLVDPLHPRNGRTTSLFIESGHFVDGKPELCDQRIDLQGALVLAGAIDIHTHIGGGKANLARLLTAKVLDPGERTVWPTLQTGQMYARQGYVACFEPAMLLSSARHTHLELSDTPLLDHGAYIVLGNEDWFLQALGRPDCNLELVQNIVAWSVTASRALAVKVVNPGGISAFKFNQRQLDLDTPHPRFGTTPRKVIQCLTAAVDECGLAHPLHLHASNLGMPGNIRATIQSLEAAEGRRLHLTHAQFNCYTDQGPHGMGSGSATLADYVNEHPNISIDVGQIVFGQTVTISADVQAQFRNQRAARPKRAILIDHECQSGCGAVPMQYSNRQYVGSLQWTIGLELMLLIKNPWQVFLTTDHPNGGPFTAYPHLMMLLMDHNYRKSLLERLHPAARERTLLRDIDREYSLDEMAITTRAAPARILGLAGLGSLASGCQASLAAYEKKSDWETTFQMASHVFHAGQLIVENGCVVSNLGSGNCWRAELPFEAELLNRWAPAMEQMLRLPRAALEMSHQEAALLGRTGESLSQSTPVSGE